MSTHTNKKVVNSILATLYSVYIVEKIQFAIVEKS